MALWILNRPAEHCDPHELRVAEWLARLPDEWVIRWGFYYTDEAGVSREGDFLILGPQGGLLVLEVKGGRLNHLTIAGRWNTENRDHPLTQLKGEWAAVRDAVNEVEAEGPPLFVGHALGLPQLDLPEADRTYLGIPREAILTGADLREFPAAWPRLFPPARVMLDARQRERFFKTFGKGATPRAMRHFITETERLFLRQMECRYELLDTLGENRQFLVSGGTGTGKTWLAFELACRWAQETEGKVLFLCYNLALAHLLENLVAAAKARAKPKKGEVVVMSWEALARSLLEESGIGYDAPPEEPEERLEYFTEVIPALLVDLVRGGEIAPRYAGLVVDEAQDHDTALAGAPEDWCGPGWWGVYWPLLTEGSRSRIALFYDQAQRPAFRDEEAFDPAALEAALDRPVKIRLKHAVRYTAPILEFLRGLESEATELLLGGVAGKNGAPDGPDVAVIAASRVSATAEVERVLRRWIDGGLCKPEEVLILSPHGTREKSCLGACEKLGDWRVVDFLERKAGCISVTSVNKAKGLDALAVILVDFRPFKEIAVAGFQTTYFMGASRARQLLAVVHAAPGDLAPVSGSAFTVSGSKRRPI